MGKIVICVLVVFMLAVTVTSYAQQGDLIVNGKLGVGTENPANLLTISNAQPRFEIIENDASADNGRWLIQGHAENLYLSTTNDAGNLDKTWMRVERTGLDIDRVVIPEGNVGIGTSTPSSLLTISNAQPRFEIIENDVAPDNGKWLIMGHAENLYFSTTNDAGNLDITWMRVERTGINVDRVIIPAGNVGIGTANPIGKLDVNGSIYQRGSQLHADYVFEPKYKLESIEDHSDFMWKNKHLKSVPKASVDENGLEVVEFGNRNKGVVEELEKAHIYIEQLNERIKALEDKIVLLEK